eukprot:5430916-Pyramimonas_sp.AAC.1
MVGSFALRQANCTFAAAPFFVPPFVATRPGALGPLAALACLLACLLAVAVRCVLGSLAPLLY